MTQKGIRTQHPEYMKLSPIWQRCLDVAEGELTVHEAGERYLPRMKLETTEDYSARKGRTPLFNATWQTISGLKGMLFRKPPQFIVPAAIEPYLADIDMAGTPIEMFAQETAEAVLTTSHIGLLVDHPPMPTNEDGSPITVAQAEALGLRPMIQRYSAQSVINWKCARVNNVMQLVLVVLKESASTPDDAYSHASVAQYRELTLTAEGYRQRVFQINDQGDDTQIGPDVYPLMNGRPIPFIPFLFVNADSLAADADMPPLLDLVNMNLHHYTVSSSWEHGCHYSGRPTLFVSGYTDTDKPIYIGGSMANALSDPAAKAWYAEVQGNFEALRNNLEQKKNEMAVLGARMLENSKTAVESSETLKTRLEGEHSQLSALAQVLSMALTKALQWMADWSGAAGQVEATINRDFVPAGMSAQELTSLVGAWQAGMPGASGQNVYALMQRKEMADPAVTYEEEQERIASSGPRGDAGLLV